MPVLILLVVFGIIFFLIYGFVYSKRHPDSVFGKTVKFIDKSILWLLGISIVAGLIISAIVRSGKMKDDWKYFSTPITHECGYSKWETESHIDNPFNNEETYKTALVYCKEKGHHSYSPNDEFAIVLFCVSHDNSLRLKFFGEIHEPTFFDNWKVGDLRGVRYRVDNNPIFPNKWRKVENNQVWSFNNEQIRTTINQFLNGSKILVEYTTKNGVTDYVVFGLNTQAHLAIANATKSCR